jgi:IclR family acetate operon transcriptional repressor
MEAPHATSVGKAILAWLPEEEIKRILAGGMKRFTDRTITDLPTLLESLRLVRRNGYAIDREEFLPGVLCVGAAIRDQAGTVIGAISASTPTMRANDEHIALMRQEITTAARGLSAEFGEPGSQSNGRPQAVAN